MSDSEEMNMIPLEEYKEELKVAAVTVKKRSCPLCNLQLAPGEQILRVQIVYSIYPACIGYKKLSNLYKQIEYEKKQGDIMRERMRELFDDVLLEMRGKGASANDVENWSQHLSNY